MKYEALYSAVLSAAPTVLIGYVLEIRFMMNRMKSSPPTPLRWQIYLTIIGTSLSAIFSIFALSTAATLGESPFYATVVTLGLISGFYGLTNLLLFYFFADARDKEDAL